MGGGGESRRIKGKAWKSMKYREERKGGVKAYIQTPKPVHSRNISYTKVVKDPYRIFTM